MMKNNKYSILAEIVNEALRLGREAAAQSDDGGSANMDTVVLCGLKGVRESTLVKAGIPCDKKNYDPGCFWLHASFGGIGNKRNAGVEATAKHLKANGVDCYIYYQMD